MLEVKIITEESTQEKYLCIKESLSPDTETRYHLSISLLRTLKDEVLKALGEL